MAISPELKFMPGIAATFTRAGLTGEIIKDIVLGSKNRDLGKDAKRLVAEYEKSVCISIMGLENIPNGGLIAFNHPDNDILLPGMLKLIDGIHQNYDKDVALVIASEIMLTQNLNEKTAIPGSVTFMKRIHGMYPNNIISAPTASHRRDFDMGRALAARKVIRNLNSGNLVAISPEGHVEVNGSISPIESFHSGTGALARLAAKLDKQVVPVGLFYIGKRTNIIVNIGTPFKTNVDSDTDAVNLIMQNISELLPLNLRGPYKNTHAKRN